MAEQSPAELREAQEPTEEQRQDAIARAARRQRAAELREKIIAVRDVVTKGTANTMDQRLAELPDAIAYDRDVQPYVMALRSGLAGLQLPPEPEA